MTRLSTLESSGKWPDSEVDYTTGCEARRANWPAQDHWVRICIIFSAFSPLRAAHFRHSVTMAAAWHGGIPDGAPEHVKNKDLRQAISRAADYWFSRDFSNSNPDCLDSGNTARCPCDNPAKSLWYTHLCPLTFQCNTLTLQSRRNTNWFSSVGVHLHSATTKLEPFCIA